MNKEFIKWLVGYAEGFECNDKFICYPKGDRYDSNGNLFEECTTYKDIIFWVHYPLLLQRAIEGINKTTVGTVIDQYCDYIEVTTDKKDLKSDPYNQMFPEDIGFDAAKEEALKYTWEKME